MYAKKTAGTFGTRELAECSPITLLRIHHENILVALEKLETAPHERRQALLYELGDVFTTYARILDEHWFPAMQEISDARLYRRSHDELSIMTKVMMKCLSEQRHQNAFWSELQTFKRIFLHHLKEQEMEFFPKAARRLHRQQLEAIGREIITTTLALVGTEPRFELEWLASAA